MTTATITYRDKLQDVRERLRNARQRQKYSRDRVQELRNALSAASIEDGRITASPEFQAAAAAQQEAQGLEREVELLEEEQRYYLTAMAGVQGVGMTGEDSFLNNPDVLRDLHQLAGSSMPVGDRNLGPAINRDELVGQWGSHRDTLAFTGTVDTGGPSDISRLGPSRGVVSQLRRRLTLLDLIPTSTMDSGSFEYTQESGSLDFAAETAEGSVKPGGDIALTDATCVARTIPAYFKLKRQQLADVPSLQGTVQNRLVYGVRRRLENQILSGSGVGENLLGILNTTGIGAPASAAGDITSDTALNGIVAVMQSSADPNGVVLNPVDYAKILKAKSTQGERVDSDGALSQGIGATLWGLPCVLNLAVPAGHALVGDFALGATVFVREGVNVRISDSDQDDFLRNQVTMLGEGRFGLAVWQPAAFAYVTLA